MILNENDLKKLVLSILKEDDTFGSTFGNSTNDLTQKPQPQQPSDVKNLANVQSKATTVNKAASRINNTTEFSGAFKNWFSTLGYKPENSSVSISRVQQLVRQAMIELGYK